LGGRDGRAEIGVAEAGPDVDEIDQAGVAGIDVRSGGRSTDETGTAGGSGCARRRKLRRGGDGSETEKYY
jgi:hypothetical protein